jgi:transketolase
MSVSDVAYFRSLTRVDNGRPGAPGPACRLFQPSDAVSAYSLVELMANVDGMCYMRTHRPDAAFLYAANEKFDLRGWKQLRQGKHLTLVSSGFMLHNALAAAAELAKRNIDCNVFDVYAFPLDASGILDAARRAGGAILTVEDNYIGGLHAELAESAAASGDVRVVGLTCNRIPKSAKTADEVFDYTGVGIDEVLTKARELARK